MSGTLNFNVPASNDFGWVSRKNSLLLAEEKREDEERQRERSGERAANHGGSQRAPGRELVHSETTSSPFQSRPEQSTVEPEVAESKRQT